MRNVYGNAGGTPGNCGQLSEAEEPPRLPQGVTPSKIWGQESGDSHQPTFLHPLRSPRIKLRARIRAQDVPARGQSPDVLPQLTTRSPKRARPRAPRCRPARVGHPALAKILQRSLLQSRFPGPRRLPRVLPASAKASPRRWGPAGS